MSKRRFILLVVLFLTVFFISFGFQIQFVSATQCWSYLTNSSCSDDSTCLWKADSWGSYCTELACWNLNTENFCTTTTVPGKNCTWQPGQTNTYCSQLSCWTFSKTNQTACVNNTAELTCQWNSQMSECQDLGCWSYTDASSCTTGKDPWNKRNCTWYDSGGSSYCTSTGCWSYGNQSSCDSLSYCGWESSGSSGWCQEKGCWDYKNQTSCSNSNQTIGKDCKWENGYCSENGCWNYQSQNQCNSKQECAWTAYTSTGYCNEINCWTWDGWNGGSQATCLANASLYGLDCIWNNGWGNNASTGWCQKDYSSVSCANKTNEYECSQTYYCWWEYVDWNNISGGGTCKEPSWGTGNYNDDDMINDWNPGCYIFDNNQTECNSMIGCIYNETFCDEITPGEIGSLGNNITKSGLRCSNINDSVMCSNIAALSTCCMWQNGSCADNRMSNTCFETDSSVGGSSTSCEDANKENDKSKRKENCEALTKSPLYWPCSWDNSTENCLLNADDIWGNKTKNLVSIENKKLCGAAGGKWITENYCEGNTSVPTGKCEYKFDDETNCNKACFACEKRSDGTAHNSSNNAERACLDSALGFCEFESDDDAPNGYGYCKAKEQFKKGIAEECSGTNCGACTFMGDPEAVSVYKNGTKSPKDYCEQETDGDCKWVTDNSTGTNGYCLGIEAKICEDACDRCNTQDLCQNQGKGGNGGCEWVDADSECQSVEDTEVCYDAEDNDDDGLIDCADSSCFSDSFCGFVEGGCFGYQDNSTCAENDCEWVSDKWGSWCDYKGSRCWKNDMNSSACVTNAYCKWENSSGTGWCERDWSVAETCWNLNSSSCVSAGCNWTQDSWCNGQGNSSSWCETSGGWCDHPDFAPKNCWNYYNSTTCGSANGCAWKADQWSQARCDIDWSKNCWENSNSSSCVSAGCDWRNDSWGGWCTNKMDVCWNQYNQTACGAVANTDCTWQEWYGGGGTCQAACFNSTLSNDRDQCGAVEGCVWKDAGWCQEDISCWNVTNSVDANSCDSDSQCRWRNPGWCSPKDGFSTTSTTGGGGGGSSMGADCWKYDNNMTLCTNETLVNISCSWSINNNPSCGVDWSKNCWGYMSAGSCNASVGCWWNPGTGYGAWCSNLLDQCWSNVSYQSWNNTVGWAGNCTGNALCTNNSWGGCEPKCFSKTNANDCSAQTGCNWNAGWCISGGVNDMFDDM